MPRSAAQTWNHDFYWKVASNLLGCIPTVFRKYKIPVWATEISTLHGKSGADRQVSRISIDTGGRARPDGKFESDHLNIFVGLTANSIQFRSNPVVGDPSG